MGAILEPTVDMGPYGVEIRRESAYLRGDDTYPHRTEGTPAPLHTVRSRTDVGFAIPTDDRAQVVAALRQIADSPAYGVWMADRAPAQRFAVVTRGSLVYLLGPVWAYGPEDRWVATGTVEVEYVDVDALIELLSATD